MEYRLVQFILLSVSLVFTGFAGAADQAVRPNVLFLISDDLDCRIGCYGDETAKTPNLDRLAAMGVRFDKAYCQFPLCNPTRCSVLSGRYPTSTGVLDNNTLLMLPEGHQAMPEFFESQGYAVAEFGKIWHGPNRGFRADGPKPPFAARANWFTPQERAEQQAEDPEYWEKNHSPYRNLTLSDPERYSWANEFGPLGNDEPGKDAPIADKALVSLKQLAEQKTPFFLAVGFHKPHVPLKCPQRFFDLYERDEMPLPPDFANEPHAAPDMPPDDFRQNIDLYAARAFTATEARDAMRAYYACVTYMDFQVGRLLDELDRLGLRENTIVMMWGDHGWHLSEKGMWAKGTLFEVSARGPLIIADPRIKATAGQTSPRVVQYLDMYPTLVELCGLTPPPGLEGTSLVPLLNEPHATWNRPAYTVQTRSWFIGRSVRTERWRYTEWDEGRRGAALYDHDCDPYEMRNLANDPQHASTVTELKQLLHAGAVRSSGVQ